MRDVFGKRVLESDDEVLAPSHTALVVVDMQNDFGHPDGHFARNGQDVSAIGAVVGRVARLVDAARASGVLVVWIQQTTLPDARSDSPAWLAFKMRHGVPPEYTLEGSWGQRFLEPLAPRHGEPVVQKHRSSAFRGTALDSLLRNGGVESIVVCGCVTEGCVESTVRDGAFHDFYATVAEDAVGSIRQDCREASLLVMGSQFRLRDGAELEGVWQRAAGD
jgi:ureidoacrylate peracid hydrolase